MAFAFDAPAPAAPAAPADPAGPVAAPGVVSPALAANIGRLTEMQAAMPASAVRERHALLDAFDKEVSAGGDGSIALGRSPDALRTEELAKAGQPEPDVQPGAHAPEEFTRTSGGLFASPEEAQAFGEVASSAGFDPVILSGTMQELRNDPAIQRAIAGGDDAIDAHLQGVRASFEKLSDGPARLQLAIAFLNHLAEKSPHLEATVTAAMMSPNALSYAAYVAESSGFKPPPVRR